MFLFKNYDIVLKNTSSLPNRTLCAFQTIHFNNFSFTQNADMIFFKKKKQIKEQIIISISIKGKIDLSI